MVKTINNNPRHPLFPQALNPMPPFFMGKSTISMAIFNSYVSHNQRVNPIKIPLNPINIPSKYPIFRQTQMEAMAASWSTLWWTSCIRASTPWRRAWRRHSRSSRSPSLAPRWMRGLGGAGKGGGAWDENGGFEDDVAHQDVIWISYKKAI